MVSREYVFLLRGVSNGSGDLEVGLRMRFSCPWLCAWRDFPRLPAALDAAAPSDAALSSVACGGRARAVGACVLLFIVTQVCVWIRP